ncbi:glutamate/gamma-aminobutyrate family transporter YjeM [Philodulcilactobacillus myokoensis]|uniref:Glutamate/gamma-aminobutyrate family transporter YjeM n=1 Tax=Philodulcilactobacillus myokoensis TaxID=2929573 RepID=A0A9W6B0B3_9LACO|nr:glutamate/gamma-aminobutyrate family transporter YjeM [Philodulcilactobacillus myokoensis]GLB46123.1 glutamate/gamma-aminobutyrate family transporter YjeM [Philodulcilactobacillus myokoensis]
MDMTNKKRISLATLVLMILSTAFGLVNSTNAFYQMGYASIIWYIIGALTFFLPSSLMFAEYGSALSKYNGGMYSWMKVAVNEKFAFIGTFIWLCAWVMTLIDIAPNQWITFSTMIFGKDETTSWSIFGLNPTETVGILSIALMVVSTLFAVNGLKSIEWMASVGGVLSIIVVGLFAGLSVIMIFLNHGQLAQPITSYKDFLISPNPAFKSPVSIMSFIVYAIFAYAGVESISGVIDKLHNPAKTFPRGVMISTVVMTISYSVCIFLCGYSINWSKTLSGSSVTLGNVMFVIMGNLGFALGHAMGLSAGMTNELGIWLVRFTGFATFLSGVGEVFVLLYSPLKSFILGSSKRLWPKKIIKLNKHGMPANAMWIQCAVMVFILFFTTFGGSGAQKFYTILTDMNNVSSSFQYIFIVGAFPMFKKIKDLNRPFNFYNKPWKTWTGTSIVMAALLFGIIFNFIQPMMQHDYQTTFWTFFGPVLFGGGSWLFYEIDIHVRKIHPDEDEAI